ncbi:hypothetical protein TW79_09500 [Tritonibacter mobilis]|uniref:Uncharacterized protein n=1 Tax=Tritonibacter mobilis F1926 TaxID=1265309 RepID=A0A1B1AAQ6_9RHOB|nr:hypothetical protein K529_022855 [Tritonibacter mobilis F1926]KJZ24427.1 hypothetical protein TW79_09500 [Tritonibacter mobilis]
MELSNLPVEVSSHEALAKQFDAVHLCLCAAPAVIPGQLSLLHPTFCEIDNIAADLMAYSLS